jgi:O-succinylbenzoic acid--CoA ligase
MPGPAQSDRHCAHTADGLADFANAPWQSNAAPALCIGARSWSYGELYQRVQQRELALRGFGLGSASRSEAGFDAREVVVCAAQPGLDLILMQHALARIGAALLPVRPDLAGPELTALIRQTGAEWRWLPATNGGSLLATGELAKRPLAASGTSVPATAASPIRRLAVLIQTSGSSGVPKVAMLTQDAVLASCTRINLALGLGPGDQWLCCLPLQHVGGLAIGYRCALAGATLRLQRGLAGGFDTAALAADLALGLVTHLSLVPPMLARLLDAGVQPPPSLRVLLLGGQALHAALARRAVQAGWPLYLTYGMSETFSQVATARYAAADAPPTRIGRPLDGIELDCGRCGDKPRALRLRGPMLMAGYANPARRPGDGLRDGWLETADLGCVDAAGALHLLGRADDVLVIGGVKVLPARVEEQLAAAPGVDAVAVVGVPHPLWGRTLVACYTGSATEAAIDGWCRAHLPGAERPRIFMRCAELPLLASGKLDRSTLVELASAGP